MLAVHVVEGQVRAIITDDPAEVGTEVVVVALDIDQPMRVTRHTVKVDRADVTAISKAAEHRSRFVRVNFDRPVKV